MMTIGCVGGNVVILAKSFNPSLVSQHWLVKHQLAAEGGFLPGCIQSDEVAVIQTAAFHLLVMKERLQFTPSPGSPADLIGEFLPTFFKLLPHVPYTAGAINFIFELDPGEEDYLETSRRLFFRPDSPPYSSFDQPGAAFGAYMSTEFGDCRLRLNVRPLLSTIAIEGARGSTTQERKRIQFSFNYHQDLPLDEEDQAERLSSLVRKWAVFKAHCNRVLEGVK